MSTRDDRPLPALHLSETQDLVAQPPHSSDTAPRGSRQVPDAGERGGSIARKRRRTVILAGVLLLAVAALSWWAGRATTTTSALAHRSIAPATPVLTAPVVRKRLGMTLRATGRLVAAGSETITIGAISVPNAESIVTADVIHSGEQIGNGAVVAQVAGRPVFVFTGSTPMYRSLARGESGPDVAQLQQDLASIGYAITDSPGSYGASTSAALAALYRHAGYSPPPAMPYGRRHPVHLIVEPQSEIVFLNELPATVAASKEPIGKPIGTPAVTLTYGSVVVDATLTAAQGYLAQPGDRATVTIGQNRPLVGVIRTINRSVSQPTATATIALRGVAADARIGSSVPVSVDAQSSAVPTLALPIGALYANGDGSAYVILAGHGGEHVPVTVGQAVGGYVPVVNPPLSLLPGTELVLDAGQAQ